MARTNVNYPRGFIPHNAKPSDLVAIEVASNYGTAIYPGEPVVAVTTGYVQRTPAGSAAGAATDGVTGVVVEVIQYRDPAGFLRRNAKYLPASTTYTAHGDRSILLVCLATEDMLFRVNVDDAWATRATQIASRFANVDHEYGTADTGLGITGVGLNASTLNTTATLQWRVLEILDYGYADPLSANNQALVKVNLHYGLPVLGHSTTAI